jgi:hypothetical protein
MLVHFRTSRIRGFFYCTGFYTIDTTGGRILGVDAVAKTTARELQKPPPAAGGVADDDDDMVVVAILVAPFGLFSPDVVDEVLVAAVPFCFCFFSFFAFYSTTTRRTVSPPSSLKEQELLGCKLRF